MCKSFIIFGLLLVVSFYAKAGEPEDTTKSVNLNEVVVTGNNKNITTQGSVTKIKIHGTPFSQMGTVLDMLSNIPGLYNNGTGIQVAGRGTPVIYLDGRELTEISQLSILQAEDIKDVRIERAPDAKFAADTKAVILLTTYTSLQDNIYLNVNNTLGVRRKVSDYPGVNFKARVGKFVTSLNYQFGSAGSEIKETYFRNIKHADYDFESIQDRKLPSRTLKNTVNWSGEYQINSSNRVGLYYYFTNSNKNSKEIGVNQMTDDMSSTAIDVMNRTKTTSYLHSISCVYDYNTINKSFHVSQDFAYNSSDFKSSINETNDFYTNLIENNNETSYKVSTTNMRADFVLPWQISSSMGAKFIYVKSNALLGTFQNGKQAWLNNSDVNTEEYTPQAYMAFARMFGKILVSPGLRYEYTYRRILSNDKLAEQNNVSKYYASSVYPFLTINYNGEHVNAYVQYSRKVVHPAFNILNSGVSYVDTLTYVLGNPNLKATTVNDVKGGIDIGDFTLGLQYTHNKNPFENVEFLINGHENIVYSTWINFPWSELFMISASYGSSWGNLNYYGGVDLNFYRSRIWNAEGKAAIKSFSVDAEVNLTYQFNKHFSIYANYVLQGRRTELATTQRSAQNFNVGVTAKFIKNRLSINLELMDILGKADYNNLSTSFMNVTNGTRGNSDLQGVRLRISYTIFNKPIKIIGSRENADILQRIK